MENTREDKGGGKENFVEKSKKESDYDWHYKKGFLVGKKSTSRDKAGITFIQECLLGCSSPFLNSLQLLLHVQPHPFQSTLRQNQQQNQMKA